MKFWLVRHAQPLVEAGVCYGASDILADEPATAQAAQALALELPSDLKVMCSPLTRCTQLANALQQLRPDLTWKPETRLAEMNFGHWEGQRWNDIPAAALAQWTTDFGPWRFGGVESVQDLMQRVSALWEETRSTQVGTLWVTHAGVIRAATLLSQGVQQVTHARQWPQQALPFGRAISLPM